MDVQHSKKWKWIGLGTLVGACILIGFFLWMKPFHHQSKGPESHEVKDISSKVDSSSPEVQKPARAELSHQPEKEISNNITSIEKSSGCVTVIYSHKKIASHGDGEACLNHRNLLKLKVKDIGEGKINPASICVRVDGAAVKHSPVVGKTDEIWFAPGAGPQSKVEVHYCLGKAKCKDTCKIENDEFMDALGAEEKGEQKEKVQNWDGTSEVSQDERDLESEAGALDKDSDDIKTVLFEGWIVNEVVHACEKP